MQVENLDNHAELVLEFNYTPLILALRFLFVVKQFFLNLDCIIDATFVEMHVATLLWLLLRGSLLL